MKATGFLEALVPQTKDGGRSKRMTALPCISLATKEQEMSKPILFSGHMVRAILDGRKTQTRHIISPQPTWVEGKTRLAWVCNVPRSDIPAYGEDFGNDRYGPLFKCKHGPAGIELWVRETHAIVPASAYRGSHDDGRSIPHTVSPDGTQWAIYKEGWVRSAPRWRPSIHMPRWASRITLTVHKVRVQRLQSISPEDAIAEGIEPLFSAAETRKNSYLYPPDAGWKNYLWHGRTDVPQKLIDGWDHQFSNYSNPVGSYSSLWQSINGASPYGWSANPWVWVIDFSVVENKKGENNGIHTLLEVSGE